MADNANHGGRAIERAEELYDPLLGQLVQSGAQLLRQHGVFQADIAQKLGREAGHAAEIQVLALGQRIANAQDAVIGDAHHIARPGLLGHLAVLGEEEKRRIDRHLLAGADLAQPHPLGQPAGAEPHESHPVTVIGIHIGLNLEDEAGQRWLIGLDIARVRLAHAGRRRVAG